MSEANDTLYLVDGSSYLYRAYYAVKGLSTRSGQPTGAMFGVLNMLRSLVNEQDPEYVAVVFDAPGKTFRHDQYPQYKANRPPMPDDLRSQVEPLLAIIEAMGFPLLRIPDVEADDVIGTLAVQASKAGQPCVISTSDKDLAQLVDDKVSLVNTMTGKWMDREGVVEKFGVPPELIIDYLALIGDTVDNVPGVPKVGPKTATKWLNQYESLDGVVANADQIGGKIGENLRNALDQLPLSKDLVTIKLDVDLDVTPDQLEMTEPDRERLRELYTSYEFKSWLADLGEDAAEQDNQEEANHYELVLTDDQLDDWIKRMEKADLIALDVETTSIDPMQAELVGISMSVKTGEAAYVPVGHQYLDVPKQLELQHVLDRLRPVLSDPDKAVVGQHFKYDLIVFRRYGLDIPGWRYDTMLESYVYNSSGGRHDMDSLAMRYLGRETIHYEDVAGKGAKQKNFSEVELDVACDYAAEDAEITLALHEALWPELNQPSQPLSIFEEIEMPLAPVLARIESHGVLLNMDFLHGLSKEFAERMVELEKEAYEIAGGEFNLASPKQLQKLLFEDQNLPVIRKTPKGQPSTAEDVLTELAKNYPLPKVIIEHRSLSKLKSTYTDKLPEQLNPHTGRVHTSYHQAVASTGRLSSADPNLQNIPIRTAEGRRIREAFIAPEGFKIMAADYSQIELRIMAHLSGDEGLLTAFREGRDIHSATAAEVFNEDPTNVPSERRRAAKAINFGLIYGMSAFGLSKQLNIERKEAQDYIDLYFSRYPGVKAYMDRTREMAASQGYVETIFGRRLYLPEINSKQFQRRQASERAAINAPMQGTAADIIKLAMIDVEDWLARDYPESAWTIMQVHDELVLEVKEDAIEAVSSGLIERMERAAELNVPLVVEVGVGENWDQAH